MNISSRRFFFFVVLFGTGLTFGVYAQQPPAPPAAVATNQTVYVDPIEFQGANVGAVVEWYARLTNRSVIAPSNLPTLPIYLKTPKLPKEEAIGAIESVLAINGISLVPLGDNFVKVVQIAGAKQEGVTVGVLEHEAGKTELLAADTMVTQIIPLKFADAAEVVTALQPYLHAYGQLLALAKSNSILITETAGNIKQMLEIVRYVDQPSQLRMETKVYVLQNARAADVVQQVQAILQQTEQLGARATAPAQPQVPHRPGLPRPNAAGQSGGEAESVVEGKVVITSDARTNKIFLLSRASNFEFFDRLLEELDAKVEPDVLTKVIALDYASAEDVASLLSSLISGAAMPSRAKSGKPGTPAAPPPPPSAAGGGGEANALFEFAEGVRVLPDTRTNSLLVMASKHDLDRIEELVHNMDTPVAQVLIEVVIAEVKLSGTLDVGVDAIKRVFGGDVRQTGLTGSGAVPQPPVDLTSLGGSELFSGLVSNAAPLAAGAASGGLTYFLTFQHLKLDAVIRLLSTSSRFKVLSTPIIQTMHNQEADIIVGESRPVITSTVSDVNSTASTAVRSNVEFKDIAIELKVTPRINPDGFVSMDIEQKVNDLGGTVKVDNTDVPIITKREAKSSVAVRDGNTIVLGGLIREDKTLTESKVPLLGDIPFFGQLFKSKHTDKNRTELIVFIRPTVLRNEMEAAAEARRRAGMLHAGKELELDKVFEGKATAGSSDDSEHGKTTTKKQPATAETNQPPSQAVTPATAEPNKEPKP